MLHFERICGVLFGQPHLYAPQKAETVVRMLGPRLTGHAITITNGQGGVDHVAFSNGRPSAGIVGDRMGRAFDRAGVTPFDVVDGVAIIPIEGTLVHKGSWVGSASGETSYQGLQMQIARAAARDDVKAVAFEVDSFGGMVNGAFETAAAIRDLSKAKPTIAILSDYALSAGYLLASQARQVVVPEFGQAGSIGVVTMHADYSGKLEQEGIRVTFIHAGSHKVDGNPYEPLPIELARKWQDRVEAMRQRFADAVGQGRRGRFSKAAALKTEAEIFDADEALRLGLVDAIASPDAAFAAFRAEMKRTA